MLRDAIKQSHLAQQKSLFKSSTLQLDTAMCATYMVSKILAENMKPFSDREIIKECMQAIADITFHDKKETHHF
jgi:hypothetical protein